MAMNTAQKRYLARFFPVMALYVASVVGVSFLFILAPPVGVARYAVALLPALPIIGVFYVLGRYLLEETDEFLRLRQVMALLVGGGLTLSLCAIWGFLEIYAHAPAVGVFNVVWIFFGAFGFANLIVSWWYR